MESFYFIVALLLIVGGIHWVMTYDILDYRLITKDRPNAGIVEVLTAEKGWGLICTYHWSFELTSAVCEYLNFPGTSRYLHGVDFDEENDEWSTSITANISTYYRECSMHGMELTCSLYDPVNIICEAVRIAAVTCKEPGYLGCFIDYNRFGPGRDRLLSNGPHYDRESLTIDLCINECREDEFFYAGVEFQIQCFCGRENENYRINGSVLDEQCHYDAYPACPGDGLESCGARDRIAVYLADRDFCDDPGSPANGSMFIGPLGYGIGGKVYFNCSDGFILEGPDVIQCVKTYVTGAIVTRDSISSQQAVMWNDSLPNCTGVSPTTSSSAGTTQAGAETISKTLIGTLDPSKQEGDMNIIYISIGIVFAIVIIIVVIIVLVIQKRHNKRNAARLGADGHDTDNNVASRNAGNGGGIPLMPRHDDEDLFELSALASRSSTAEGNHYDNEGGPQTHPGSADISSNTREGFGYESIRLPAESSPLEGGVSVGGATDLYANTDFHEVPSNMIENELYG